MQGHLSHLTAHHRNGIAISAAKEEGLTELLLRVEELLWREGKSLTASGASFQDELPAH